MPSFLLSSARTSIRGTFLHSCCALAPAVERERETLAIICAHTLIVITYPRRGREIHGSAACACNRPIVDEISRHLPLFFFFFFFFFVVFSFFQHVVTRSKVKRHSPWWLHCLRLFLKNVSMDKKKIRNWTAEKKKGKERKVALIEQNQSSPPTFL
jgi:hypothetical protein